MVRTFNNFVHYLICQGPSRPSEESEDLLIDWTEEKEAKNRPWDNLKEFEDPESKVSQWIQFNEVDMNSQFERY